MAWLSATFHLDVLWCDSGKQQRGPRHVPTFSSRYGCFFSYDSPTQNSVTDQTVQNLYNAAFLIMPSQQPFKGKHGCVSMRQQ